MRPEERGREKPSCLPDCLASEDKFLARLFDWGVDHLGTDELTRVGVAFMGVHALLLELATRLRHIGSSVLIRAELLSCREYLFAKGAWPQGSHHVSSESRITARL